MDKYAIPAFEVNFRGDKQTTSFLIHLQCFPVRCKPPSQRGHSHFIPTESQAQNTTLFDITALSQTPCRITAMLIILLAVFLHKQDQDHAKMFWGVISMLL